MFKIGDIVVKTKTTNKTYRLGSKEGDIWKINKLTQFNLESAYYPDGQTHSTNVRKATPEEIKWFEAGITNINQIPEVGASFDFVDEEDSTQNCKETIKSINTARNEIFCSTDNYDLSDYVLWLKNNNVRNYKPPTKTWNEAVPIDTPFEVGDLENCKIGNLTPEDHEIIQPWLNKLGFGGKVMNDRYCLYTNDISSNSLSTSSKIYFKTQHFTEIKKETILNYIKQLNTNNNYEQINKKAEIKPESRTIRGSSISIPTITGRIASASRLIGNKASGKCVKSEIRKFKISANIVTC